VQKFSGGMKRRVNLAIGVIHNPSILFLDEPTVGVDVQTRHAIIGYLMELNKNGTTLIYTSHQLIEAERLCEDVALIDNGKIMAHGNLDSLLALYKEESLEQLFLKLTGKDYRNDV
jgi:ABC-2 type transport system ATP-binding protein